MAFDYGKGSLSEQIKLMFIYYHKEVGKFRLHKDPSTKGSAQDWMVRLEDAS